jgi:MinD superfamily P-loop ATPase
MSAIRRGKKAIGSTYKSKRENLTLYTGELIPNREESALVVDQLRERVFREAKDYDMILVDTSPGVHCNVIKALQGSDCVIAVTEPTPLAAHDLELILRLLDIFELKAAVFLNRADLPSAKEAAQKIARQHDLRIAAELDTDALLVKSYVSGIPVVTMCPEAASTRVFLRLAEALAREYLT